MAEDKSGAEYLFPDVLPSAGEYGPVPHWAADPTSWATLVIGSIGVPGICTVEVDRQIDIDVKKSQGKASPKVTVKAPEPAKVTVEVKLFTEEDLATWQQDVSPLLEPDPKKGLSVPIRAYHPVLRLRGIDSIQCKGVKGPKIEDSGIAVFSVEAIEWRPEFKGTDPKTSKSAKGSSSYRTVATAAESKYDKDWHAQNPDISGPPPPPPPSFYGPSGPPPSQG